MEIHDCLKQCWLIFDQTHVNKFQWNTGTAILMLEFEYENIVCKMLGGGGGGGGGGGVGGGGGGGGGALYRVDFERPVSLK